MKKLIYGVFAFAALTFTSCGGAETQSTEEPKEEETVEEVMMPVEYQLNNEESTLEWTGSWVGGKNEGKSHNGVIKMVDGVMVKDGESIHGKFAVDMSSINVQDLDEASGKPKLEGHLANEDFFNVSQYAMAEVQVMEVNEGNAKIMLLVGGTEMERTIPISFEADNETMTLEGEFSVDFADAGFKGMKVNPEKPEEGAVSSEIKFNLHAKLMKR